MTTEELKRQGRLFHHKQAKRWTAALLNTQRTVQAFRVREHTARRAWRLCILEKLALEKVLELVTKERDSVKTKLTTAGCALVEQLRRMPRCGCGTRFCVDCARETENDKAIASWKEVQP